MRNQDLIRLVAGAAFVAGSCSQPPAATSGPTTMFRGGPEHTGVQPGVGSSLAGIQWSHLAGGDITGSVVAAGGVAYAGSGDGALEALDLSTGAVRWTAGAGSPIHSTPAVGHGRVFVATRDGHVVAFDAATGAQVWSFAMGPDLPLAWGHESGDIYLSSPLIAGDRVIVGGGDGAVHALDAATGRELWQARTGGRVRSSPASADGLVFAGSMDGIVYAFGIDTGEVAWTYRTLGADLNSGDFGYDRRTIQSSPAVVDGTVYIGARDGLLYALDAASGALRWKYDHNISWVITSPAVADGVVYAGSSDAAFVQAIDAATGREVWRTPIGAAVWSSPIVSGDQLLFGEGSGRLLSVDRSTGAIRWAFRAPAGVMGAPVVADSMILTASVDGRIFALRTTNGPAVHRAVFFDSAFARTTWHADPAGLARYFEARSYTVLDAAALASFVKERTSDHEPSVIVFAIDHVPPSLASDGQPGGLLRGYLDAGDKVVWPGIPPLMWPRDPVQGVPATWMTEIGWAVTTRLLGVDHEKSIFGASGTRATEAGLRWGLAGHARTAWAVDPAGVSEVLGLTELGLAGEWVRSFGGPTGTGFVRLEAGDNASIYNAAEYRPSR